MGDPDDRTTHTAAILEFSPGHVLQRHAHSCERPEIIVSGSLDVGGGNVQRHGDVMQTPYGEFYRPHIAGPNDCVTAEIFSTITANGNVLHHEESPV